MAANSDRASWSSLEPMDPVHQPRRTTKADLPRLGDRVRDVLKNDLQHQSAWGVAVCVSELVLLSVVSSLIWGSGSSSGAKVVESVLALALVIVISTAILVKIRFGR